MEEILRLIGYLMIVAGIGCFALAWLSLRPADTNKNNISLELSEFLSDWYCWATTGAPEGAWFSRRSGLCVAAFHAKNYVTIGRELQNILQSEFGTSGFPFGRESYSVRAREGTQHLCPRRLSWVAKKIGA